MRSFCATLYIRPAYIKADSDSKTQSCSMYCHPVSRHFLSLSLGQHFTLSLFAQNVRFNVHPQAKQQARFFNGATAASGPALPHYRDFMITLRHTTVGRTPLDEWSARRRTSIWQHTTLTIDIYSCHRRDSNPQTQQVNAAPRLRPRGHWDRQQATYINQKMFIGCDISGALGLHLFVDMKLWNTFQKCTAQWASLRYRTSGNLQLVFLRPSYAMQEAQMFSTVSAPT